MGNQGKITRQQNVHFAALFPWNLALITHNATSSVNPSIEDRKKSLHIYLSLYCLEEDHLEGDFEVRHFYHATVWHIYHFWRRNIYQETVFDFLSRLAQSVLQKSADKLSNQYVRIKTHEWILKIKMSAIKLWLSDKKMVPYINTVHEHLLLQ